MLGVCWTLYNKIPVRKYICIFTFEYLFANFIFFFLCPIHTVHSSFLQKMHLEYVKNMNMLEDTTVDIQVKYHIFPASLFTCTLLSTVFLPTPNKSEVNPQVTHMWILSSNKPAANSKQQIHFWFCKAILPEKRLMQIVTFFS